MNKAARLGSLLLAGALACGATAQVSPGAALRTRYEALNLALAQSPFGQPLVLESVQDAGRLQGDIHALVNYPFALVSAALRQPERWCEALSLHPNTKYCRASSLAGNQRVLVQLGAKTAQDPGLSSSVEFRFRVPGQTPDTLEVELQAPSGPWGTTDYRIRLEAVSLPGGKTFLHLTYSNSYGLSGRLALQAYLATAGSSKVGFSQLATTAGAAPQYVGGMRGLVERNTMRYYLAIDAVLESFQAAPETRLERRLQRWFTASEQYQRQLHELDWTTYRQLKLAEQARQQDSL